MPLSEHEQRQLEQIEQALYADYPKLAHSVRAKDPRIHYRRRIVQAGLGFVLGVGLLLGGVISTVIYVSVGGFVVILASAMWAVTTWRHLGSGHTDRGHGRGHGARQRRTRGVGRRGPARQRGRARGRVARQSFMERLEERWRRRQERGR